MGTSVRKLVVPLVLAAVLCALGLIGWRAAGLAEKGWSGIGYYWNPKAERLPHWGMLNRASGEVISVIPGGPADRAGMRAGDRIAAINGIPIAQQQDLQVLSDRVRTGTTVSYEFIRQGRAGSTTVQFASPLRNIHTVVDLTIGIIIGLTFVTISVLVFARKSESPRAFLFFLTSVAGGFMFFAWAVLDLEKVGRGILPTGHVTDFWSIYIAFVILAVLLSCLLLHFALIFPKPTLLVTAHPRIVWSIYAIPLLPATAMIAALGMLGVGRLNATLSIVVAVAALSIPAIAVFRQVRRGGWSSLLDWPLWAWAVAVAAVALPLPFLRLMEKEDALLMGMFYGIGLAFSVALISAMWALFTCAVLIASYRRAGLEERRQVRWPLWGIVVALGLNSLASVFVLVSANMSPEWWMSNAWPAVVVSIAMKIGYVFIPITFAFAITRYRLMNIDVIIKKTFVYGALTAIIIFLYLGLVGGAGVFVMRATGVESQVVTIVSTLVIAAIFVPARNRLQAFVDRRFFRRKYDYPVALRRMGEVIGEADGEERLLEHVAPLLRDTLQVRAVEIVPRQAGTTAMSPAGLVMPVQVKEQVTHDLVIGSKLSDEEFDIEDQELIDSVAAQLALAIENLRARKEEREYEKAREIQQALLPSTLPQLRGVTFAGSWNPAREVGGDYFDVIRLDDSSAAVCIADVVGKGMPAALLMSGLQASVHAVASADSEPAEVCARVRRVVARNLSGGKFITFFYGVVDEDTRTFRFTNAGHNPGVLVRADGSVSRLSEGGAAFGRLFLEAPLSEGSVSLLDGDRIVLFSDGLTEAARDAEQFGDERLIEVVRSHVTQSAPEIERAVVAAVQEFSDGKLGDDATLVVLAVG